MADVAEHDRAVARFRAQSQELLTGAGTPQRWLDCVDDAVTLGLYAEAEQLLQSRAPEAQVLALVEPDSNTVAYLERIASIWRLQSRFAEAVALLAPLVERGAASIEMRFEFALCLASIGNMDKAFQLFQAILAQTPDHVGTLSRGWAVALTLGHEQIAHDWIERARVLASDDAFVSEQYADYFNRIGDYPAAFDAYHQVHQRFGRLTLGAITTLRLTCRHLAVWGMLPQLDAAVLQHVAEADRSGQRMLETPLLAMLASDSIEHIATVARLMVRDGHMQVVDGQRHGESALPVRSESPVLRIGYLLGNEGAHPVIELLDGMFRHHDRSRFHVTLIVSGLNQQAEQRARLSDQVDHLVELAGSDRFVLAEQIRSLQFDILIDLDGLTGHSRVGVMPLRPAPVTATWLGFAGPMPAGVVDYQIVDDVVVPAEQRQWYGAALAYLPTTYKLVGERREIADCRDAALPEDRIVLGCFSQIFKIQPELFVCWMEIMAAAPDTVLWLGKMLDRARDNLCGAAERAGIAPERLIFADFVASKAEHLGRLRRVDIALDTWRYGGHVGTIDMLLAGVPVIAREGTHFASRVSQSLLLATGMDELITPDAESYRDLAVALASDPDRLSAARRKLATAVRTSRLFDTQGRVRDLERLYEAMWQRHRMSESPADLRLG